MRGVRDRLTGRGVAFVVLGGLTLMAGLAFGQHDLSRVGGLLLVLPAAASLVGRRHRLALGVERAVDPRRLHVDDSALVTLTVENPERTGSPVLTLEEQLDFALGDRPRFLAPRMDPGATSSAQYPVRPHTRGVHSLGPLLVRARDPFGLTLRSCVAGSADTLVVLPRVHPLTGSRGVGAGVGEDGQVPHRVALHGADDQSVREYRDGDDLRRIHWPATARSGEIMVRQEDRPARRRAVILLDSRASGHGGSGHTGSLEWVVTMAASVAAHLTDKGYAVHLLTSDPDAQTGAREDVDLDAMLDTLARVTPSPEDAFGALLHGAHAVTARGGAVVALVGALDEDTSHTLGSLRAHGSTGVAFVVEGGPGSGGRSRGAAAATTATVLSAAGWAASVVPAGATPSQAWEAVAEVGATEAAR